MTGPSLCEITVLGLYDLLAMLIFFRSSYQITTLRGKAHEIPRLEVSREIDELQVNFQHVETSLARHHKQFAHLIASHFQVNYLHLLYGALHSVLGVLHWFWPSLLRCQSNTQCSIS